MNGIGEIGLQRVMDDWNKRNHTLGFPPCSMYIYNIYPILYLHFISSSYLYIQWTKCHQQLFYLYYASSTVNIAVDIPHHLI